MYTLNTIDRPAVAFQQNQRDEVRDMGEQAGALTARPGVHNHNYLCYPETARSLCARHDSSPCADRGQNVVAIDCRNLVVNEELSATLAAKPNGGQSLNYQNPVMYRNSGYGGMVQGVGTLRANGGDVGGERRALSLSVYDARGNGEGSITPTVTGDHNGHINDYMAVLVEKHE